MGRYTELILYKVYAELRVEAARAYLGYVWWIGEPVLYMVTFYLIFDVVLHRGGENFVPFLLSGLVVWKWFGSTVQSGTNAIEANAGLMRQVYLPKFVFPCVVVLTNTIKFLVIFTLLLVFLLLYGIEPTINWLALPVLALIELILVTAVAGSVAAVVPFLPDLKLFVSNGLTLLFFLSGIFFDIGQLSPEIRNWFFLNPMAVLIDAYRTVLFTGNWPDWSILAFVLAGSLAGALFAFLLLHRFDRLYPKVVA